MRAGLILNNRRIGREQGRDARRCIPCHERVPKGSDVRWNDRGMVGGTTKVSGGGKEERSATEDGEDRGYTERSGTAASRRAGPGGSPCGRYGFCRARSRCATLCLSLGHSPDSFLSSSGFHVRHSHLPIDIATNREYGSGPRLGGSEPAVPADLRGSVCHGRTPCTTPTARGWFIWSPNHCTGGRCAVSIQ